MSAENKGLCELLRIACGNHSGAAEDLTLLTGSLSGVMENAESHGVLTILADQLMAYAGQHDTDINPSDLQKKINAYESRSFHLSIRLLKVLNLLKSEGILAVPVKGPVLAEFLYGDIGKRSFADLDIFIRQGDLYHAVFVLEKAGYKPELSLPPDQMRIFATQEYDFKSYDKNSHTIIELHWELSGRYTRYPMLLDLYRADLTDALVMGKKVQMLDRETDFLYLCLHSAKHCFEKLEMIFAIATYYKQFSEDEMNRIIATSVEMKCRKTILFSLFLCKNWMGLPLSKDISRQIDTCSGFEEMQSLVVGFIEKNNTLSETRFSRIHVRFQEGWYMKLFFCLRLFFTPTCREWSTLRLPRRFIFLYRIIRPCRLGWEFIKGFGPQRKPGV